MLEKIDIRLLTQFKLDYPKLKNECCLSLRKKGEEKQREVLTERVSVLPEQATELKDDSFYTSKPSGKEVSVCNDNIKSMHRGCRLNVCTPC